MYDCIHDSNDASIHDARPYGSIMLLRTCTFTIPKNQVSTQIAQFFTVLYDVIHDAAYCWRPFSRIMPIIVIKPYIRLSNYNFYIIATVRKEPSGIVPGIVLRIVLDPYRIIH